MQRFRGIDLFEFKAELNEKKSRTEVLNMGIYKP